MDYKNIPLGDRFPELCNAVIEIPKGTKNKYEYDERLGVIRLDRVLHSPLYYPADYGFIPQTRAEDGDMGDVLVLTDSPTFPGCLLAVRPVGLLNMSDEHGTDNKVLAVPANNPNYAKVHGLKDIAEHTLKEIVHFFEQYKALEGKFVKVEGWTGRELAIDLIRSEHEKYRRENSNQ